MAAGTNSWLVSITGLPGVVGHLNEIRQYSAKPKRSSSVQVQVLTQRRGRIQIRNEVAFLVPLTSAHLHKVVKTHQLEKTSSGAEVRKGQVVT